jgi:hypothetical protein
MLRTLVAAAAVVVALAGPAWGQTLPSRPDPARTPGVVNPAISGDTMADTICNPHWSTKSIRPPSSYTTKLKRRQMRDLGYTVANPLPRIPTKNGQSTRLDLSKCIDRSGNTACYEEDHLISLELGGDPTSESNLWPEPWNGDLNAHIKDRLENELHRQVCDGSVKLETAQKAIAFDWVAAYELYVGPLPGAAVLAGASARSR